MSDLYGVITAGDKTSPAWQKVKAHLVKRREQLRQKNDGDLDPIATAKLRGQIAEVTALINMDKEKPVIE